MVHGSLRLSIQANFIKRAFAFLVLMTGIPEFGMSIEFETLYFRNFHARVSTLGLYVLF